MTDLAILGNGVAANLAAAYMRKSMPELTVAVIGSVDKRRPIVGEALVEVSTNFIREIGLGPLLVERHHPKYGLTYYYKPNLDNPSDRTYVFDESPHVPPFPSFLINRFTFDRDLRSHNAANGVAFHPGAGRRCRAGRQEPAASGRYLGRREARAQAGLPLADRRDRTQPDARQKARPASKNPIAKECVLVPAR